MDAHQVVDFLHDAGLCIALTPERGLKVTPASSLTPELRALIRSSKDVLIDWLRCDAANDPASDPDRWAWPHSSAMNGTEIDTFTARLARFTEQGLILADAEWLAGKLVTRDRDVDDRRLCLECCHARPGRRCDKNAIFLLEQLQRCDHFKKLSELQMNYVSQSSKIPVRSNSPCSSISSSWRALLAR